MIDVDWIYEFNTRRWFEAVARLNGAPFDDAEWDVVDKGISRAAGTPFQYRFKGQGGIRVAATWGDPPDVVHLQTTAPAKLEEAVLAVTFMCQRLIVPGRDGQV